MAEIKWIKLMTDMFTNSKIRYLRRLPEGDSIVLIWVMLLAMAGRCNNGGRVGLTEKLPYDLKTLSEELDFRANTVKRALDELEHLSMVETDGDGFITVLSWSEYQNIDSLERVRELNRNRKMRQRANEKKEAASNMSRDSHVTVTTCHDAEEEADKEKDKEKDKDKEAEAEAEKGTASPSDLGVPPPQLIADMFNEICVSYPQVKLLSDKRREVLDAALRKYTVDDFKHCFEIAEKSAFLKGDNRLAWKATFDWLVAEENMTKVLEGNYADRIDAPQEHGSGFGFESSSFDTDEFFEAAVRRSYNM